MPQVEDHDEAQTLQEALEEKFSRQHDIAVADMSERNRIQDQMNGYAHNSNNFMKIEVKQEVLVSTPKNAPASSQHSNASNPLTAPEPQPRKSMGLNFLRPSKK